MAIKVLAENHSFDPDLRERFITEGHLLRRVDSPHVVSVFDLGETDAGQPFLVLDLATGGDLAGRRRSAVEAGGDEAISGHDILTVADQVALALDALHAENVVHRDVSPGNLLIRSSHAAAPPDGGLLGRGERLMLADLGLSKDLAVASGLTAGAGTAGFSPPEQGESGWVDVRADIWSASALLVWLARGHGPDDAGRWRDDLVGLGWPTGVVDELGRGMSAAPADRHPTAESWVAALRGAVDPPVTRTPAPSAAAAAAVSASPAPRHRPLWQRALAVGAAVALLVGGGWWLGRRSADDGPDQTTRTLEDGQVEISVTEGGVELSMVGPESVTVGEEATFTAEVSGADHFAWLAPDGLFYPDEPTLVVRPASEGSTTVRLISLDDDGDVVLAERDLQVDSEN